MVSGRLPSSRGQRHSLVATTSCVSLSTTAIVVVIGTISASKPARCLRLRRCGAATRASSGPARRARSRTSWRRTRRSAASACRHAVRAREHVGVLLAVPPIPCTASAPRRCSPARPPPPRPCRRPSPAWPRWRRPSGPTRTGDPSSGPRRVNGSPAASAALRARFMPAVPALSTRADDHVLDLVAGSTPARCTAWAIAWPISVGDLVWLKAPLKARPMRRACGGDDDGFSHGGSDAVGDGVRLQRGAVQPASGRPAATSSVNRRAGVQ